MERQQAKDWREDEPIEQAARRLLAEIDARKKRRLAGGQNGPAEFQDPRSANVPAFDREKSGSPEHLRRSAMLDGLPQSTVADREEFCGNGLGSWLGSCVCGASMRQPAPCAGSNESGFTVEAQIEEEAWNVRAGGEK